MEVKEKQKKTKSQIEKEEPFVSPNCDLPECPGVIIDRINELDRGMKPLIREVVREELTAIRRFMRMAWHNRVWLILLTLVVAFAITAVWVHLASIANNF